ncbi:MAG TPA: thioredoxin domain-containing protein, partial [Actinomycetota bacterium]|nr:thioredoxin domain-containing protein [Actinomycetota bacterium]
PPDDRHGLPSFRRVLDSVHEAWLERGAELTEQGRELMRRIDDQSRPKASTEPLTNSLLSHAVAHITESFDPTYGGFGTAPKFPQAPVLEFLLNAAAHDLGRSREMVSTTLRRMALGGIYDQLGGGFARYSVDPTWLIPHFEKMLYDNAQLARVYLHAWQSTKEPLYKRIAEETLDYMLSDLLLSHGGFAASEDADSEGVEGRFYVWSYEEFADIAPDAVDYYNVRREGNFEGGSILTASSDDPPESRTTLLEHRSKRIRPARDDKALTSWNGLAIGALAEAGAALRRSDFIAAASRAANFLLERCVIEGRLMHSHRESITKVTGMLEDYAYLCEGLLTLYEVTFDGRWYEAAASLANQMVELFWDEGDGGFFTTGSDHEKLIVRQKELVESAKPCPSAVATAVLQKLAVLQGSPELHRKATEVLRQAHTYMARAPQVSGTFLRALEAYLVPPREIVVMGERDDPSTRALLGEIFSGFLPNKVVAGGPPTIDSPLLEGKTVIDGKPTAYVCRNYTCEAPVTAAEELRSQLTGS